MVKIGLVAPFEGLHRNLGYEVLYAVKLAVRQYNADTGTGGPLVELVALDDTLDPGHAVEQARELTLDPDVVGVVGHLSRSTTAAALPEYERAGLPLIVPVAMPQRQSDAGRADSEDRRPSPVRLMAAAEEVQGAIAARFAVDTLKARHLVVVEGGEDTLARSFSAEAESRGAEVLHVNWPDEVDRHTIDLISMLLRDPPGAIFFAEGPVAGAEFLLGARAAGLAAPVVGSSAWGDPTFASLVADNVWGRLSSLPRRQTGKSAPHSKLGLTFYTAPCPDLNDAPAGRQFVQGYAAYVGQKPGRQAALAYDAARFLLEAIARASRDGRVPTREMVVSRLLEITVYSGAAGQYRFDGKGEQVQAPLPVVVAVATD